MELPVLFRDARFVVLDKPAGLAVHPGPRGGPSVEDCFPALSRRRDGPWLAHRLVVALRKAALLAAQAIFAAGTAEKIYWAVCEGTPPADSGVCELPLARHSDRSGWRMIAGPGGQRAVSQWRVLGRADGRVWLEIRPHTGRTHQVRAHCAAIGCPLLGDPIYGHGGAPLHLLARSIRLALDPALAAQAPVPAHMRAALARLSGDVKSRKQGSSFS
jgi:tRNA pseudouridine32 synthase/23S rRNA pseudouridine746 synthase